MTPALKIAFVVGELAALVLGLMLRPVLADLLAELRWRRQWRSCSRRMREALRTTSGIPERRRDGN